MITQYSQMRWSGPDWDLKFEGELQGYTSPKALGLKGVQAHLLIKAAQMGKKAATQGEMSPFSKWTVHPWGW